MSSIFHVNISDGICDLIIEQSESIQSFQFYLDSDNYQSLTDFYQKITLINSSLRVYNNPSFKDLLSEDPGTGLLLNETLSFSIKNNGILTISNISNNLKNIIVLSINDSFLEIIQYMIEYLNPSLTNNYKLLDVLGQGSFGLVHRAIDENNQLVAIKEIDIKTDPNYKNEVKVMKKLSSRCSDYFSCIYEIIEDRNKLFIVMEYLENYKTLESLIDENQIVLDLLPRIFNNLCEGLKLMHSYKIAHCDIKSANIMVNPTNGNIKYIDFGISCIDDECKDRDGYTVAYVDPNFINSKKPGMFKFFKNKDYLYLAQQSDLWSIGMVIYETINGTLPIDMYKYTDLYFKNYSFLNDPNRLVIKNKLRYINCGVDIDNLLSFSKRKYSCNCG